MNVDRGTKTSVAASINGQAMRPSHIRAFRGRIQDWGLKRALYWQIMHALSKYLGINIHHVHIGADRLDLRDPEPPDVPSGYVTKLGCKNDFLPFVGKVEFLDDEFVESAFARGDECSLTLYKGELVSYCFISRTRARMSPQLEVIVPNGFRYVYKAWTHADHRRQNLSRIGGFHRISFAQRPFTERSISCVATHNYPSRLHSYRNPRERSIRMGYVGWFTLFGRQYPFNSRKAKWVGFVVIRKDDARVGQYVS